MAWYSQTADIAKRIGKRSERMGGRTLSALGSKKGMAAIGAGAVLSGFSSGFGSMDVDDAFYDMTTGNPNYDEDMLGTEIGVRQLLAPIPGGGLVGAVRAGGFKGLAAGVASGLVNGKTITDYTKEVNQPLISTKNNPMEYSNQPPTIDGSIVFGQYNARHGW